LLHAPLVTPLQVPAKEIGVGFGFGATVFGLGLAVAAGFGGGVVSSEIGAGSRCAVTNSRTTITKTPIVRRPLAISRNDERLA
jgi:hypothetical protein